MREPTKNHTCQFGISDHKLSSKTRTVNKCVRRWPRGQEERNLEPIRKQFGTERLLNEQLALQASHALNSGGKCEERASTERSLRDCLVASVFQASCGILQDSHSAWNVQLQWLEKNTYVLVLLPFQNPHLQHGILILFTSLDTLLVSLPWILQVTISGPTNTDGNYRAFAP